MSDENLQLGAKKKNGASGEGGIIYHIHLEPNSCSYSLLNSYSLSYPRALDSRSSSESDEVVVGLERPQNHASAKRSHSNRTPAPIRRRSTAIAVSS